MQLAAGRAGLEVIGGHIAKVVSAVTPTHGETSTVRLGNKIVSYNVAHDFSFLYLKKNVRHKAGVIPSYKANAGQLVYVAGYYGRTFQIRQARLIGVNVPLMIGHGGLNENLILDLELMPGSSGSAVFDEYNRLLGMVVLTGKLKLKTDYLSRVSVALPVRSIAARFMSLDPAIGSALFTGIPHEEPKDIPLPAVIYKELELPEDTSPAIPALSPVYSSVPDAVHSLRDKASTAAKIMIDVVAQQCMVQGTAKPKCHEVSIISGDQSFREIRHDHKLGKQMSTLPTPRAGVWSSSDWADTLAMIAEGRWNFEGSIGEKYLFTRRFEAEDARCEYEEHSSPIPLFGGGYGDWKGLVSCAEKVVTDRTFNVLADFLEMYPPSDSCKFKILQSAVYFSWIRVDGVKSPMLLPTSERINGKLEGRDRLMFTTISWAEYRKFGSEHKIRLPRTVLLRRP